MHRLPLLVHLLFLLPILSGEPPTQPILRIDAGMHTAPINSMGIDAGLRFLVTASDDKTARLWSLPDGGLLQTFRPPIGMGDEGKLYATAISPNGALIACAGWTGDDWDGDHSVYVFDRQSGAMRRPITGLPNIILGLAFSPSGDYLALALGGSSGIRVYEVASGEQIAIDKDYQNSVYGIAFSVDGKLATSCYDGRLRLYDRNFKKISEYQTTAGTNPVGIAFSPDGSRLAAGYRDTTAVTVHEGDDLQPTYQVDTDFATNGNLSSVTWSRDGRNLFAAGRYVRNGEHPVIVWPDAGRGSPKTLAGPQDTVFDLGAAGNGAVYFVAGDPAWGRISAQGQLVVLGSSPIADFPAGGSGFRLHPQGLAVQFAYDRSGKLPARFDVTNRSLITNPNSSLDRAPRTTGLNIKNWKHRTDPSLNDKPLQLRTYEMSCSMAVHPDGDSFLLGTNWYLRYYNAAGAAIWPNHISTPGTAWAVNIAANGKLAAAAFGDGTIRWYRLSDGQELLAFFPHADQRRWVAWTPSGYYDASPGGESLIGWHVNRGKDQTADFFPASHFRDTYYRPDVIRNILLDRDETRALATADSMRQRRSKPLDISRVEPPVITLLSPEDGSPVKKRTITLKYSLRFPPDAPVTRVVPMIDGALQSKKRDMTVLTNNTHRSMEITISPRDQTVGLVAYNRHGASVPAQVHLRWAGPKPQDLLKPKLFLLAVGVAEYPLDAHKLVYPAKDARDFAAVMSKQKGGLYSEIHPKVIPDGQATRLNIMRGLEWIQKHTTSRDVAMVFFAGHGVNDNSGNFYFLPVDGDMDHLKSTSIPKSEIEGTLKSLAGKALFFMDTCYSGKISSGRRALDLSGLVNDLADAENGTVIYSSSMGNQYSLEDPKWGNGAFTKALVEGLDGKADLFDNKYITTSTLGVYIIDRVNDLTGGKQKSTFDKPNTISDYPIAVVQ